MQKITIVVFSVALVLIINLNNENIEKILSPSIINYILKQQPSAVGKDKDYAHTNYRIEHKPLVMGNYWLVAIKHHNAKISEYFYRATLTNPNSTPALEVTATGDSLNPDLKMGNATLNFGYVPGNKTVYSRNSFSILKTAKTQFSERAIHWNYIKNFKPVADAGPNQTVKIGQTVYLNGAKSNAANSQSQRQLHYAWQFKHKPSHSVAVLQEVDSVKPHFMVDKAGEYIVSLSVQEAGTQSNPDEVVISTQNSAPVADAGNNQSVKLGSTVILDGSQSSDVDGDNLTYTWKLTHAPKQSLAQLRQANSPHPSLNIDKQGMYSIQLNVYDGHQLSQAALVTLSTLNSAPVAHAGHDQTAEVNTEVTLDASASSDIDGNPLRYTWNLLSAPNGSQALIKAVHNPTPTFKIDQAGNYVAQLVVHDALSDSAPDTMTISTTNSPPIAHPGSAYSPALFSDITLDGTQSADPDQHPINYHWAMIHKPAKSEARLDNFQSSTPHFNVDQPGDYIIQLRVHDGQLASQPKNISFNSFNTKPSAKIEVDKRSSPPHLKFKSSAVIDADRQRLTYQWALLYKPQDSKAELDNLTSTTTTLNSDVSGTYIVQLLVSDGIEISTPETLKVEIPPQKVASNGRHE